MSEENQHLDLSQEQQAAPPEPQEHQQQPQQEQQQIEQQETTLSEKFNFSCSESDLINQSGHQMDLSESSEVNKSTIAAENFIVETTTTIIEKKEEDHHVVIEESMSELEAASREAVDAAIGQIARLEEQQEEEKRAAFIDSQQADSQVVIEATNSAVVEPINEQITVEESTTVAVNVNLEATEAQPQNEEKLKVETTTTTINNEDNNNTTANTNPNIGENQTTTTTTNTAESSIFVDHQMNEEKKQPEATNETETAVVKAEEPQAPIEKESDDTDAVLAVVAAVELAHKSATDSPSKEASGVKRKQPSKQCSSPASASSSLASGGDQKRRKKDPLAPKAPLNGYLVYFNEERAGMRAKNPNIGFGELTKIIATKWKELPTDAKQKYINEADQDKERYEKEMACYKKSDAYKQFQKESSSNKLARSDSHPLDRHSNNLSESVKLKHQHSLVGGVGENSDHHTMDESPNLSWLQNEANIAGFDVPIFTEEFIEHSKSREHEMRTLRKDVGELEKQAGGMLKHVEGMRGQLAALDADIARTHAHNEHMHKTLALLRQNLLSCFHKVSSNERVEFDNLDDYLFKMSSFIKQPQQPFDPHHANYFLHVKSVISKLNFNSLFNSI